jgi:ABC-type glycerol-3-phosphate transport system permease component
MQWHKPVASVEEAKQLARPVDYDYLDLLENSFFYLRKNTTSGLPITTLMFRNFYANIPDEMI